MLEFKYILQLEYQLCQTERLSLLDIEFSGRIRVRILVDDGSYRTSIAHSSGMCGQENHH